MISGGIDHHANAHPCEYTHEEGRQDDEYGIAYLPPLLIAGGFFISETDGIDKRNGDEKHGNHTERPHDVRN